MWNFGIAIIRDGIDGKKNPEFKIQNANCKVQNAKVKK
jgi:hypothetical protein